ncbi:MAG: type I-U CRISPR-associated RAMP protein Csb1/Cas7u [Rhodobacteraceae bacterium]|nr:type I-U CRISPR-associated RAMP protein Csb1/Cas7u [Paracoccaceae bacterium]
MTRTIDLDALIRGCSDTSSDSGIRLHAELEPLAGPGGTVKPAVYAGARFQEDRRWANVEDSEPAHIIVIDNVPSQANRLEDALRRERETIGVPEFVLDLSDLTHLPSHLPRQISSLQFPHRNADAYLRDAMLDDEDFLVTSLGKDIFGATAHTCGPLMAWFPQSLLYGFWQSHLGKKRTNSKHARSWVSEIIGWHPATAETLVRGMKGDPLNLNVDTKLKTDADDQAKWDITTEAKAKGKADAGKGTRLSEIGHGQALFGESEQTPAAVSFMRITQQATISFAQLRRVSLGDNRPHVDAAARALLVALGLHAHNLAFGRGFTLRSGAVLEPLKKTATWLGGGNDEFCDADDMNASECLLREAKANAEKAGVPLDGWGRQVALKPKPKLKTTILKTWPEFDD